MHQGQSVDKDGDIVTMAATCLSPVPRVCLTVHILVDHLQTVVVDVLLVNQIDVLDGSIVTVEQLNVIFLNDGGLILNVVVPVRYPAIEKLLPFRVCELVIIHLFELSSEVLYQLLLCVEGKVFIRLHLQLLDERLLESSFRLVG